MSATWGKPEVARACSKRRDGPEADIRRRGYFAMQINPSSPFLSLEIPAVIHSLGWS
jgi:hypothetical protein